MENNVQGGLAGYQLLVSHALDSVCAVNGPGECPHPGDLWEAGGKAALPFDVDAFLLGLVISKQLCSHALYNTTALHLWSDDLNHIQISLCTAVRMGLVFCFTEM